MQTSRDLMNERKRDERRVAILIGFFTFLACLGILAMGSGCSPKQLVRDVPPTVEVGDDGSEVHALRVQLENAQLENRRLFEMNGDLQDDLTDARRFDARIVCGSGCRHRGERWKDCRGEWRDPLPQPQ